MRIALIAYGCEPDKGSEVGVGWKWANEIAARGHDVVVFTHASQRQAIERVAPAASGNLSFRYHQNADWPLEHRNRAVHQWQYTVWQWSVMDLVSADRDGFDLVHFLTWGGVRMPVFGWRTSIPYVVGPVGGGEEAPLRYCAGLGTRIFLKECLRKLLNRCCLIDPMLWAGYRGAARIFAKTPESRDLVVRSARHKCDVLLEIGARDDLLAQPVRPRTSDDGPLKLIYVARLLYWKSPLTVTAVLAELLQRGFDVGLTMVGNGPERDRLSAALSALPQSRVRYFAQLPQPELFDLMREHDLALFPSLHDSSGNFVLESMSCGLPVVALALGGPRELLRNGGGSLVSVEGRSPTEVVHAMAEEIARLIGARSERTALAEEARARAAESTWPKVVGRLYEPLEKSFGRDASARSALDHDRFGPYQSEA